MAARFGTERSKEADRFNNADRFLAIFEQLSDFVC